MLIRYMGMASHPKRGEWPAKWIANIQNRYDGHRFSDTEIGSNIFTDENHKWFAVRESDDDNPQSMQRITDAIVIS